MGLLDGIIGSVLGNGNPALQSILGSILGGGQGAPQAQAGGGLGGLLEQFRRAGYGQHADSWVGTGPNQPVSPDILSQVFGQERVNQWSQQAGLNPGDLLSSLSQMLPHAVDKMTPGGRLPPPGDYHSPFEDAGTELPSGPNRLA